MLRIDDLKFDHYPSDEELKAAAAGEIKRDEKGILRLKLLKRSIDARERGDIKLVYSVAVEVRGEKNILKSCRNKKHISNTMFKST